METTEGRIGGHYIVLLSVQSVEEVLWVDYINVSFIMDFHFL